MKLTDEQKKEIEKAIDDLFLTLKAKILGRFFKGPKIFFEIVRTSSPLESIEGIFRYTYQMLNPGKEPDEKIIENLAFITGNYIEGERIQARTRILEGIKDADTHEEADKLIQENVNRSTVYIDMLVNNEARVIQAYAERSGITELAANMGIEDPIVAKLGVIDERMCKACRKLWHTEENIRIPRVYKMSELAEGYNKDHKDPKPTVGPTHPRCRHVMTFVPPNFGFGDNGQIQFKGFGYSEYSHQHGIEKTETIPMSIVDEVDGLLEMPLDDDHAH